MTHSVYEAMLNGFSDKLSDLPSQIDNYDYFTGPRYETGRHLATWLSICDIDTASITLHNIMNIYSKHKNEIYPRYGRQFSRARN
jgi:hypothetical protein